MSFSYKEYIEVEKLPRHIAIIMDGNGRWAREKGENRIFGHQNGVRSVRNAAEACAELGIECLTLYAFSTENWSRPQHEVDALMQLLVMTISGEINTLNDNNISLHAIGNLKQLPQDCFDELQLAIQNTSKNTGLKLILALSYSSRWDILNAVKMLSEEVKENKIDAESITDDVFKAHLTTSPFPDPELLIRTSGEHRISNFLLWELAYTELYFCPKMWPEFEKEDLYLAISDYQRRERRFGKTSEQIQC
ncbi:MAG: isoprenyl transferase [Sphingobacteriales bacterium]|nr:MAG: isoprenyl transferase [Sphingobacteriales bacterium]